MIGDASGVGSGGRRPKNESRRETLTRFGMESDPFSSEHESKFLLRSSPLRDALQQFRGNIDAGAKLILIAGESGVGKTALVDAMSRESKDGARTAYISDPISGRCPLRTGEPVERSWKPEEIGRLSAAIRTVST